MSYDAVMRGGIMPAFVVVLLFCISGRPRLMFPLCLRSCIAYITLMFAKHKGNLMLCLLYIRVNIRVNIR
jgi:hypothetical protein